VVRALGGLLVLTLAAVLSFTAIFAVLDRSPGDATITVGSKSDTEGLILGELMAQMLEAHTELAVERKLGLGGTMVCFEALRAGAIDLYPEYTGTGLMAILGLPVETDPALVFQRVSERFAVQYDMLWLPPLGTFNNTYALAMTEAKAAELGIERISDLAAQRELRCGFTNEFMVRDDGYPALRVAYALDFEETPKSMEAGLMYGAVDSGAVDVICAYATDGRIETLGLRTLVDDRGFFPPYQAAPLLRRSLLAGNPELGRVLERLDRHISDADMRRLNGAVDSGAVTPAAAARDYLSRSGLLGFQ